MPPRKAVKSKFAASADTSPEPEIALKLSDPVSSPPTTPAKKTPAKSAETVKSVSYEDNLTLESCRELLKSVNARNEELEQFSTHITTQIHFNLESKLQELRDLVDNGIGNVSASVKEMFTNEIQKKSRASRLHSSRKVFFPQESPLSKMLLYDDENYKTLSNIFAVCLMLWGSAMFLDDMDQLGYPNFDLMIWGVFNDVIPFFRNWFVMFFCSFLIVPFAHIWAESKQSITRFFLGVIYVAVQVGFFTFSAMVVSNQKAQFSMTLAIGFMVEQTRMSMKMHSYLREKVLWARFKEEFSVRPRSSTRIGLLDLSLPDSDYLFEELGKFAFFLFVPTLLFREKYPRTSKIRWMYVIRHLIECAATVYFAFLVYRASLPQFAENAGSPIGWKKFIRYSYRCM
jgi:sterol O-acyltransferase